MPIKTFDAFAQERKLYSTLPLSTLADTRLGIDAASYIAQVLESPTGKEPFLAATGGVPLSLATRVEHDLRILEKLRIKPVFVFPGLQPKKSVRLYTPTPQGGGGDFNSGKYNEEMKQKRDAWELYERGETTAAEVLFEGKGGEGGWELWRSVLRMFRNRNVEFFVAPYTAWAQLVYLFRHQKAYVNSLYASSEIFLYHSVDKVITSIDFTASPPTFNYISKRSLLSSINLNEEQFLDAGILVGCYHSPTFPPLPAHDQNLNKVIELVKFHRSGHATVAAFIENPAVKNSNYMDHFMRTRSMFKYSLILSSDGSVQPLPLAVPAPAPGQGMGHTLTAADIPGDLHEIFTHKLPDEIFFYLSRGLMSPQPLIWLTSGIIHESPPLCNGETTEYRRFVKEVISEGATGPRPMSLALISSVAHTFWNSRKVTVQLWFEDGTPNSGRPINFGSASAAVDRVSGWMVPTALIEDELRNQNSSTIDFSLCLGATRDEQLAARTRTRAKAPCLERKDELVANILWRFLELRGFLQVNHEHGPLARAMYYALKQSRTNDKFQDSLCLFLELVRAGVLHWNFWGGRAYSGGPSFGDENEMKSMLLIMRVLSIVPLSYKPKAWKGPLSRELLVFNSFLRSLTRSLRMLVEVTALNLLVRGDAARAREDLLDISMALPFQMETNTGFGILAKVYLDALHAIHGGRVINRDDEGVDEAKDAAMEMVEDTFENVKSPRAEVERGFRFWDAALCAIRQLHADGQIQPDLADAFETAQAWLEPMRP